jgi:hypothetical protein
LGGVEALEHLNDFHRSVPFPELGVVGRRSVELVRFDVPLVAVGLDPAGKVGPPVPAGPVVGHGAEELDEVFGLGGQSA